MKTRLQLFAFSALPMMFVMFAASITSNADSLPPPPSHVSVRTPVKIDLSSNKIFTVASGQRLIIETVSAEVTCRVKPGAVTYAQSSLFLVDTVGSPSIPLPLQARLAPVEGTSLVSAGFQIYAGTLSARIVLDHPETIQGLGFCRDFQTGTAVDTTFATSGPFAFGYLISANSPNLAP
jgi:hypothetical protein